VAKRWARRPTKHGTPAVSEAVECVFCQSRTSVVTSPWCPKQQVTIAAGVAVMTAASPQVEGYAALAILATPVGHLCRMWVIKNFKGVHHLCALRAVQNCSLSATDTRKTSFQAGRQSRPTERNGETRRVPRSGWHHVIRARASLVLLRRLRLGRMSILMMLPP
jgi:hypothetical protein